MVEVIYNSKNKVLQSKKNIDDFRLFLLNKGSFLSLPSHYKSKYDGYFVFSNGELYKILDDINFNILDLKEADKLIRTGNFINLYFKFLNLSFFIDKDTNALCIESNTPLKINLHFDIKKIFDHREWGRYYKVMELGNNTIVIHFVKKTDSKEDSSHGHKEYEKYVIIKFNGYFNHNERWIRMIYEYDIKRESFPYERYVYSPGEFNSNILMLLVSDNIDEGLRLINSRFRKIEKIKLNQINDFDVNSISRFDEIDFAYALSENSIKNLSQEHYLMAGLPWFYQEWTRDESFSLNGLWTAGEVNSVKRFIENLLKNLYYNGKIYSNLHQKKEFSIDTFPWLFKRIEQFLDFLNKKNLYKYVIDKRFMTLFKGTLLTLLDLITKYNMKGHLVYSNENETWMDSNNRKGFFIEIQAMYLYLHKLAYYITKEEYYKKKEIEMKIATVRNFFYNDYLIDTLEDKVVRPNIFIAYYFYPELLSYGDWIRCFDIAIRKLWLPWGGFSTIDKYDKRFTKMHTGENVRSYHNGDSWYFLNNIAAISMYKLDKTRYSRFIADIVASSTKEILWMNALGTAGELSSAIEQTSEGCFCQAWSNSSYIELINEVIKQKSK